MGGLTVRSEHDAVNSECADIPSHRFPRLGVAVEAHIVVTQVVLKDEENMGLGPSRDAAGVGGRSEEQHCEGCRHCCKLPNPSNT